MLMSRDVDEQLAMLGMEAARQEALELGINVSIAVVDSGGNLKAFLRMDGAEVAGPTLAVDKAYTAVANRITTAELGELAVPGGPLFGIHSAAGGRYITFAGGVPIRFGAAVIGAVGVSGGSAEEDAQCAEAAVRAMGQGE